MLPQALAFNAAAPPQATMRIARAIGAVSAAAGLLDRARDNGALLAWKDIGMQADDRGRAADIAMANPYWNPRPIAAAQRGDIRALLQRVQDGARPD